MAEQKVAALEARVVELEERVTELEGELAAKEETNSVLEGDIANLRKEVCCIFVFHCIAQPSQECYCWYVVYFEMLSYFIITTRRLFSSTCIILHI